MKKIQLCFERNSLWLLLFYCKINIAEGVFIKEWMDSQRIANEADVAIERAFCLMSLQEIVICLQIFLHCSLHENTFQLDLSKFMLH